MPLNADAFRTRCGGLSVRQACLPAGVDPVEQAVLDSMLRRRRRLTAGQALYRSGEAMSSLFVARSGTMKTTATSVEGDEHILAFVLPGELLGLDGLGSGRHRCDAFALEPAEICELDYEALIDASASLPHLRAQLHRVVGQAIGRDHDHSALLTRRLAHERIAGFLDDLVTRYCLLGLLGPVFRLPMSRDDIARFLGLTLESVSRGLGRLQDLDVLGVRGREIEVLDAERLVLIASGRP